MNHRQLRFLRATALALALFAGAAVPASAQTAPSPAPADLAALENALAADPENPARYIALGDALIVANQGERASKVYGRLVELRPNDCAGHEGLARAYMAQNLADHAMRAGEAARKECPTNAVVHLTLSRAYVAGHEDVHAIESAQRAIELDPNRFEGYTILGETLYARGMYPEAVAVYEAALQRPGLQENSTLVQTANARLARLYFWGGAFDRAQPYLDRALATGGLDAPTIALLADDLAKDADCRADLRLQIGDASWKSGDADRARPAFERVFGCGNDDQKARARTALDEIAAASGNKSR